MPSFCGEKRLQLGYCEIMLTVVLPIAVTEWAMGEKSYI